jgi:hypothetical protein
MIDAIPVELCLKIGNFLSYREFENVNNVIQLHISKKELFVESQLFHTSGDKLQHILKIYGINKFEFYDTLHNSAWDFDNIYELLLAIDNNNINFQTKYDYSLAFDMTKINKSNIESTIVVSQILMLIIEEKLNQEFVINNPYHYLCLQVTNTLVFYFQNIITNTFQINKCVRQNSVKFILMMLEHDWYRSNINIYNLFVLYLSNIDAITSDIKDNICEVCDNNNIFIRKSYKNDVYESKIHTMFQGGKYNDTFYQLLKIT